jgi:RNA polymerase sigma factor (sigma-70 family)
VRRSQASPRLTTGGRRRCGDDDRPPFDDRFQVACLGLVHALDRFDPRREVPFGSYARPTIRGELKRHFRDGAWELKTMA